MQNPARKLGQDSATHSLGTFRVYLTFWCFYVNKFFYSLALLSKRGRKRYSKRVIGEINVQNGQRDTVNKSHIAHVNTLCILYGGVICKEVMYIQ